MVEEAQEDEVGDESLVFHQGHCSCRRMCQTEGCDLKAGGLYIQCHNTKVINIFHKTFPLYMLPGLE